MKSSVPHVHPEARERVIELVRRGKYIPAIKFVREATGAGLKEAKEYVDGLRAEAFDRMVPPEIQARARALIIGGRKKDAAKLVRKYIGLDARAAKDYVRALQMGHPSTPPAAPHGVLSDRVRAFKHAGDYESAVALVCAETGMGRDEAQRFVDALR
ncbi:MULTISPECIES: ribosomal protein L7/L12 [unclassified Spirillospora]|uniref:ribosomal protein L7/L12 n=1 Tax=unclassified Spirillospora TaxID=2642701 RepID=UPI0037191FB9